MSRILFIFNPVAGVSQIRPVLVDIVEILTRNGHTLECLPTRKSGDARKAVQERKEDYDFIVCAGGDGTLDEVVNGMMACETKPVVPIGYIPAGTTNDFAASVGIPSDMTEAALIAANGIPKCIDIGLFRGRENRKISEEHFVYVAAFGLFTETSYETPQDLKNMLGHSAYILQGLQELGKLQTYHVRVETDELTISDEFAFGMISNSKSVGGFANITGDYVDMTDGLFEVTLVKMPRNLIEINDIIQYMSQTNPHSELVYQFKASHVVLESEEVIRWTLDGEYGGAYNQVELLNQQKKMQIIVPSSKY